MASVLVVDDDAGARRALSARIASAGLEVALSASGCGAPAVLDDLRPAAVVLDANMPDLSGPDLCRRIKERESERPIPVVFVSGAATPSPGYVRSCARVSGGDDFFTKPVDHTALIDVLRELSRDTAPSAGSAS